MTGSYRHAYLRWTRLLSGALALLATGCTTPSESRQVADKFMDLYYARANIGEAVKLCSGEAKTKLDSELRALQGVAPDAPANKPASPSASGRAASRPLTTRRTPTGSLRRRRTPAM